MLLRNRYSMFVAVLNMSVLTLTANAGTRWEEIIASQSAIVSGELEITNRTTVYHGRTDHEVTLHIMKYHVWFDGDLCRVDATAHPLESAPANTAEQLARMGYRRIRIGEQVLNCLDCDDMELAAGESLVPRGTSTALGIAVYPPLGLGCIEGGLSSLLTVPTVDLMSDRFREGNPEMEDGENEIIVRYPTCIVQMDLTVDEPRLPKSIQIKFHDGQYESTTSTEWQSFDTPKGMVRFPKSVEYVQGTSTSVRRSSRTHVSVKSLNRPIDKAVFSWSGLDLPDGKLVSQDDGEAGATILQWNGEDLVPYEFDAPNVGKDLSGPARKLMVIASVFMILAIATTITATFLYRRGGRASGE